MAVKVGINGFGRIGRSVLRAALGDGAIEFVAVNDLTDTKTLTHLLKYDSVTSGLDRKVSAAPDSIKIGEKEIRVFGEKEPSAIDWSSVNAEIVVEATGRFTDSKDAGKHLGGTVKKVIVSALAKDEDVTIVFGVNENEYEPENHNVISNASCTTNCLAPIVKIIHEKFVIRNVFVNTVHSYTNGQHLLDLPYADLRRARAATISMIPTSTGAGTGVERVIPELKGKIYAASIRVPTPNVSLIDMAVNVENRTTPDEVNRILRKAANGKLKGILGFSAAPLVSADFRGDSRSSIVDAEYTNVIGGTAMRILAWYDNEWGYSCRIRDLVKFITGKGLQTIKSSEFFACSL